MGRENRFRALLGGSAALLALVWAIAATFVVMPFIERAYVAGTPPIVRSILDGLEQRLGLPYTTVLSTALFGGVVICLLYGLIVLAVTAPGFYRRFVGPATPGALAGIRILTCAILLAHTLWENLPSTLLLPVEMRNPLGMMHLLYLLPIGFTRFVESPLALHATQWTTALLLLLSLLGWRTRLVVPLAVIAYVLFGGMLRQYAHFFHVGIVPLYVLTVLAFTPCGDAWSLDRLRRIRRGQPVADAHQPLPIYGWSRYACWVVLALTYLSAGVSKLTTGGLFWWNATNLKSIILTDSLNPMEFDWKLGLYLANAPDAFFALLGFTALFGEVFYLLVLFSPLARWVFPPLLMSMHIGIWLLQNVLFFDLILMQLIVIDMALLGVLIQRHMPGVMERLRWLSQRLNPPGTSGPVRPPDLPPAGWWQRLRAPFLVSCLGITLLTAGFYKVELYPFTAMQMYSVSQTSGVVTYYKLLGHQESGAVVRAYPERHIRALADSRYRLPMQRCFRPDTLDTCRAFLLTAGQVHNNRVPPGQRYHQIEVQQWTWNFRAAPQDPDYGQLSDRVVIALNTSHSWIDD